MIQDWIRIDGMFYGTKKTVTLTITDKEGYETEIVGKVVLFIDEVDGEYQFSRRSRAGLMSEETYPTLALAKINMLKYMTNNSF